MTRATVSIGLIAALLLGCTSSPNPPGTSTSSDAIAAYVVLPGDAFEASELFFPITMAAEGEPAEPGGMLPGLRGAFSVRDSGGVEGLQIVFQDHVTTADRERLATRLISLDLEPPVWLGELDEWPNCVGGADCYLVRDTPSLP